MKKKTAAAWASVLAVGIVIGAISGANATESKTVPEGFLTADQTLAEFHSFEKTTDLALPDGVDWPRTPPAELNDTEGAFELGFTDTAENLYWLCAWEDTLVVSTASRNSQGAQKGADAMKSFPKSKWFTKNFVDPYGSWKKDVLEPALAGDLTGVNTELESCGYFYANQ